MVLNWIFVTFFFAVVLFSCESAPAVLEDGSPDAARLYNIHCAACHKPDGTGGISGAKSLVSSSLQVKELEQVIRNGQGDMMPFKSILNDAEISAVAAFVHDFKY